MALPAAISCLLLSLLIAVTPVPCTCEARAPVAMAGSWLIQCYDPVTNATNGTTSFRASLLPLLAALPSAAAPTGFASLSSAAAPTGFASSSSTDRAFVRGLCFGDATVPPSDCLGCLSVAARNITASCGATARRAGIWTDGCFVAYADTNASSPAEDDFRSRVLLWGDHADTDASSPAEDAFSARVPDPDAEAANSSHNQHAELVALAQSVAQSAAANISGARMLGTADAATARSTVHVLAQCAMDLTAAECVRCLQVSGRALDWDIDADRRDGGVASAVVGFNCYLRFEISTSVLPHSSPRIILGRPGGFAAAPVVAFALFAMQGATGRKILPLKVRRCRLHISRRQR